MPFSRPFERAPTLYAGQLSFKVPLAPAELSDWPQKDFETKLQTHQLRYHFKAFEGEPSKSDASNQKRPMVHKYLSFVSLC